MKFKEFIKGGGWKDSLQSTGMKIAAAKPEIMLGGGIISVVLGTIYACIQTEKAKNAIKECKEEAQKVEETVKMPAEEDGIEILPATKKQIKLERGRQYTKVYGKCAFELLKIYGIPALFWFGGMGMICGGHHELRHMNKALAADLFAGNQLLQEYRSRVAEAMGEEKEQKIFNGAHEEMIEVIEKDPETGEEVMVQKKADVFYAQPGSIFARNFTEETSDAFDVRSFADHYLQKRVDEINAKLETGWARAYNGMDILRMIGFNENALTERMDDDDSMQKLLMYGISGNARKVPDPEMRKLKVTRLRGYQKKWDVARNVYVYVPCTRLDFNFYPLEGKI